MAGALATVGNASSVHRAGRAARRALEAGARGGRRRWSAPRPRRSSSRAAAPRPTTRRSRSADGPVLVSAIEHDSVLAAAPDAERLPVDAEGRLDLDAPRASASPTLRPALVSVMLANNETGVIQPVAEVAALAAAPRCAGPLRCRAGRRQAAGRSGRARRRPADASRRTSSAARRASARWCWARASSLRRAAARRRPGAPAAGRHREPAGHRRLRPRRASSHRPMLATRRASRRCATGSRPAILAAGAGRPDLRREAPRGCPTPAASRCRA